MRADEEEAYVEYVRGRTVALRRTAFQLCGDWHEAHDLVQAALLKLYRHWSQASTAESPDAYVRRILVNTFLDQRQSWWARRVRTFAESADRPAPDPGTESRLDLMAALARISPGQRAVLVLRFWDGLDVSETARTLGCSTGTVKSQTSLAIAALRRLMPDYVRES
ncbi:SigE family RNA polymerase sigma factor [Micromonospora sp. NPDC050417]|uniref:SigE family RNA polymerase sigma factor n=1 Tax=Micromonospora sp. NPDC050417 TaxID=3364280 RepID=UPI00379F19EE